MTTARAMRKTTVAGIATGAGIAIMALLVGIEMQIILITSAL